MCKRSSFGMVFNIWLAVLVGVVLTIFSLAMQNQLSIGTLIPGIINGSAICFFYESIVDLPKFGNFFVAKFGLKMESKPAYFVRIFFIALLLVFEMTLTLMFCNVFFTAGPMAFLMGWLQSFIPTFIVAYVTVLITFPICFAATKAMCTKEG